MTKRTFALLVGIMASATVIVAGPLPAGAGVTSVPFAATYTSGPDTFAAPHCAAAAGGAVCQGEASGAASYKGGWDGSSTYAYRYSVDGRGTYHVIITETFTGSVPGCGAGSFVVHSVETIQATGVATSVFAIVAHEGSGDLSALSGHGTGTAAYFADGTGSGSISGTALCSG